MPMTDAAEFAVSRNGTIGRERMSGGQGRRTTMRFMGTEGWLTVIPSRRSITTNGGSHRILASVGSAVVMLWALI